MYINFYFILYYIVININLNYNYYIVLIYFDCTYPMSLNFNVHYLNILTRPTYLCYKMSFKNDSKIKYVLYKNMVSVYFRPKVEYVVWNLTDDWSVSCSGRKLASLVREFK